MGFLKKLPEILEIQMTDLDYFEQFRNKTFEEFWNLLPNKLEFFSYEKELTEILEQQKLIWIKKATGLGITEFFLRWIAWACFNLDLKSIDVSVILITGPRIELAIQLIDRLKALFDFEFETKNTVCILNGIKIEAFPSHHLATARGLNPKIVFLDEADFFPPGQQEEARAVSERYMGKTNPYIVFVSTPYLPGGLYDTMEREENSIYRKIKWNYQIGLQAGKFSEKEIEEARRSPTFEREYNLQYGIGIGNIFPGLDEIIMKYDLALQNGRKVFICDPAYGSSKFGTLGLEKIDDIVYVKEAAEYDRPSPSAMLEIVAFKAKQYDNTCLVDSAHPGLIRDLQEKGVNAIDIKFGQPVENKLSLLGLMTIEAAQAIKEKRIRIHPDFHDLISQLKSVKFNDKGHPDKKELTFDLGDCFLMGCGFFKTTKISIIKINTLESDD